jgi:hypothetical protein
MLNEYFQNSKSPTLEETYDATVSSSTAITLNTATQTIEVTALLKGIFMKWGGTASSTDYDEFIAPDFTRIYVVPINPTTNAKYTTVEFIEEAASAHLSVIEK